MLHIFSRKIVLIFLISIGGFALAQPIGTNLPNYDKMWLHFGITINSNVTEIRTGDVLNMNAKALDKRGKVLNDVPIEHPINNQYFKNTGIVINNKLI